MKKFDAEVNEFRESGPVGRSITRSPKKKEKKNVTHLREGTGLKRARVHAGAE